MSLLKRMQKNSKVAHSAILAESTLFDYDRIVHDVPIINIAFAGSVSNGGIVPGVTIFAGKSKHGKSLMALSCVRQIMKASLNKGKECPCLFYDSEFGTPKSYINSFGIDSTQILHCPITDIEQLKFDIVSQLQEVGDGENLVIFIDSIGNAASKKEVDDTLDSKSTADMTRAKQLKSLFRMITPYMRIKKIHLVVVAHTYDTMEMFCLDGNTLIRKVRDPKEKTYAVQFDDGTTEYYTSKDVLTNSSGMSVKPHDLLVGTLIQ